MRVGQARKRDANEHAIVTALKAVGATIVRISADGAPDLLVGFRGRNWLLEVKASKGLLRANQAAWATRWSGKVTTVRSPDEALIAIGAIKL